VTRRQLLSAAGGALAAAVTLPRRALAAPAVRNVAAAMPVQRFRSRPTLKPPSLAVARRPAGSSSTYLFVAPLTGQGQHGPLILDEQGEVVWFHPLASGSATAFRAQRYRGKPVLTWWEGDISDTGVGTGTCVIYDSSYRQVAVVKAGNGYHADLHEFLLTPQGTALICAYNPVTADLSPVGGSAAATVLDSIVQEIDVATGRVLFEWHSLDHVDVSESYIPPTGAAYDYFHVNSIEVDAVGNLLVSARNTSALYTLDRRTGAVLWRVGGKRSDFELSPAARFMFQHDARVHADGSITLFDDGPSSAAQVSRAIRLGVDRSERRVVLQQEFRHPDPHVAVAMGSAQVLADDSVVVGWGTVPSVTQFASDGTVRFDANFGNQAWNYRAVRLPWVGRPATKPAVETLRTAKGTTVFVSWNGSTETAYWRIAAGNRRDDLRPIRTVAARGFETAVSVPGRPTFVSATALDRGRARLGGSGPVRLTRG
jgi:outer membrane protein assembly factor BamB